MASSGDNWRNLSIQDRIRAMNDRLDSVEDSVSVDITLTESEEPPVDSSGAGPPKEIAPLHQVIEEEADIPKRSSVVDIWRQREGKNKVHPSKLSAPDGDAQPVRGFRRTHQTANKGSFPPPPPPESVDPHTDEKKEEEPENPSREPTSETVSETKISVRKLWEQRKSPSAPLRKIVASPFQDRKTDLTIVPSRDEEGQADTGSAQPAYALPSVPITPPPVETPTRRQGSVLDFWKARTTPQADKSDGKNEKVDDVPFRVKDGNNMSSNASVEKEVATVPWAKRKQLDTPTKSPALKPVATDNEEFKPPKFGEAEAETKGDRQNVSDAMEQVESKSSTPAIQSPVINSASVQSGASKPSIATPVKGKSESFKDSPILNRLKLRESQAKKIELEPPIEVEESAANPWKRQMATRKGKVTIESPSDAMTSLPGWQQKQLRNESSNVLTKKLSKGSADFRKSENVSTSAWKNVSTATTFGEVKLRPIRKHVDTSEEAQKNAPALRRWAEINERHESSPPLVTTGDDQESSSVPRFITSNDAVTTKNEEGTPGEEPYPTDGIVLDNKPTTPKVTDRWTKKNLSSSPRSPKPVVEPRFQESEPLGATAAFPKAKGIDKPSAPKVTDRWTKQLSPSPRSPKVDLIAATSSLPEFPVVDTGVQENESTKRWPLPSPSKGLSGETEPHDGPHRQETGRVATPSPRTVGSRGSVADRWNPKSPASVGGVSVLSPKSTQASPVSENVGSSMIEGGSTVKKNPSLEHDLASVNRTERPPTPVLKLPRLDASPLKSVDADVSRKSQETRKATSRKIVCPQKIGDKSEALVQSKLWKYPSPKSLKKAKMFPKPEKAVIKDDTKAALLSSTSAFKSYDADVDRDEKVNQQQHRKTLVSLGRRHSKSGSGQFVSGSSPVPSFATDGALDLDVTSSLVNNTIPFAGTSMLAQKKEIIEVPFTGGELLPQANRSMDVSTSREYESDATPKTRPSAKVLPMERKPMKKILPRASPIDIPIPIVDDPSISSPPSIQGDLSLSISVDSGSPRFVVESPAKLLLKKKQLQAERRRLRDAREMETSGRINRKLSPSKRASKRRNERMSMGTVDEHLPSAAVETSPAHGDFRFSDFQQQYSASDPGMIPMKSLATSPLQDDVKSDSGFSVVSRTSSTFSGSSLADKAKKHLQAKRQKGRRIDEVQAPERSTQESLPFSHQPFFDETAFAQDVASPRGHENSVSAEEKRMAAGMSTRYNTSSRFMDSDLSMTYSTPVAVDEPSLGDTATDHDSASDSYRTIESASSDSRSYENDRRRTSRNRRHQAKPEKAYKSSLGAVPENFLDESAGHMGSFTRAFESLGIKQIAADVAREVSNATVDITKLARGVNDSMKSLRSEARTVGCKSLPKCDALDAYVGEDVAIEVEYLEDSVVERDDPAADLGGHCTLVDEAVVDEEDLLPLWSDDVSKTPADRFSLPTGQPSFEMPPTRRRNGKQRLSAYV